MTRTYQNSGNEVLNISMSSDADGFSMDPASASISPGETSSFTFSYNAENYTINSYQVPSEMGTIKAAVDAAMPTNFDAAMDLIDNDNYNEQSYVADYSYTGDTIMVAPGTYTENILSLIHI